MEGRGWKMREKVFLWWRGCHRAINLNFIFMFWFLKSSICLLDLEHWWYLQMNKCIKNYCRISVIFETQHEGKKASNIFKPQKQGGSERCVQISFQRVREADTTYFLLCQVLNRLQAGGCLTHPPCPLWYPLKYPQREWDLTQATDTYILHCLWKNRHIKIFQAHA